MQLLGQGLEVGLGGGKLLLQPGLLLLETLGLFFPGLQRLLNRLDLFLALSCHFARFGQLAEQ